MKKLCMYFFVAVAILLVGCERSNDQGENFDYSSGTLLVNEGSFGNSNGSISWYSNGTVKNGIFEDVNGSVLGDVIMDADRVNALTYVVSNNSQKVVVLKSASFEYVNAISGFEYPRHFLKISDSEAAVSDGSGAGSVKWIDLNSSTISATTAVGNGPEEMLLSAGKLFVCNSGGWGIDNTISVIDVATKQVINTVVVENRPVEIAADENGVIWVLCSGETQYDANWNIIGHTPAALVKIDPVSFGTTAFGIGVEGDHPTHMAIDGSSGKIYIANQNVEIFDLQTNGISNSNFISGAANAIGVEPASGNIWVAGPTDYVSASEIRIYQPNGSLVKSFNAGIATRKFLY